MRKSIIDKIVTLTLSSFVIKALGFVFRIYLSGKLKAEGMGLYQLILSVYAFGATISVSGMSAAISRLTAMYEKHSKKILKTGLAITGIISLLVTLVVYTNAEYIGLNFIGDERTVSSVRIVSLSFPAIALFACVGGYFNGLTLVKYPIRGQITEQIARITFIFLVLERATGHGMEKALNVTSMGILLGEFISTLYIIMKYMRNIKAGETVLYEKKFLKPMLKISIPVSLNGYFQSFIHSGESVMLPLRFVKFGLLKREAVSYLGVIKGMTIPLIFFPASVLSAVSTILLPHISKAQAKGDKEGITRAFKKSFLLSLFTGLSVTVIFFMFGREISYIIYKSYEVEKTLKLFSVTVTPFYINMCMGGVLNGLGKQNFLLVTGIISGVSRFVMIFFLVPKWGVYGYVASLFIVEMLMLILNLLKVKKEIISKNFKNYLKNANGCVII